MFDFELDSRCRRLRGSLTELLSSIGVTHDRPTDIARRLQVNRTLAWKAARIVSCTDALETIDHLPGAEGVDILLDACANAGAPPSSIATVRTALAELEETVRTHAGDRHTLELMLASVSSANGSAERAIEARRLAFLGNSAIWGIQARVRFAAYFVAPAAEGGGMLDAAIFGGLVDVRRLRPDVSVPLFMLHMYNDDGTPRTAEPLDAPAPELPFVREFCTDPLPALRGVRFPGGVRYELGPGPVGNTGRASWVFSVVQRRVASMYRDARNDVGEHATRVFVPAEMLQCDLYVHRDLAFPLPPQTLLYSQLAGTMYPGPRGGGDRLPLAETVAAIGSCPPVPATPWMSRYSAMIEHAFQQGGWNADEFHGFRFAMRYPPIPTVAVLRYPLLMPPDAQAAAQA